MEVTGFPEAVSEQILKLASINLCPNLSGQICCALMMNPPQQGEPSYELYSKVGAAVEHVSRSSFTSWGSVVEGVVDSRL